MADKPVCGAFGIIPLPNGPCETSCDRPPHKHGDHENEAGDCWPSYEGEYDEMLKVTTGDLRELLASGAVEPVLYVACDEDTGEPVRLEVGPKAHAHQDDIVVTKEELGDALGGPDHPDGVTEGALEHLLELYQAKVDELEEAYVPDDACVADGVVHPEHDYPDQGDCRRCGAEQDTREPDGIYNGEIR